MTFLKKSGNWTDIGILFIVLGIALFLGQDVYAADTTWQDDYYSGGYTLDTDNHYIKLTKYSGTETTHTVPAKATIDDVEYTTYIEGGSSSSQIWADSSQLTSLSFDEGLVLGNDLSYLFYNCSNLTDLDVSALDTSKVTSMASMFMVCQNLYSLNLSTFDTSNVTDMGLMFYGCSRLNVLNLTGFDTSNVTNMANMFQACAFSELDLSSFNTSKVENMAGMFYRCEFLQSLDLSNFDTSHISSTNCMFDSCLRLTSLDVSHFDTSNVTDMGWMFSDCSSLTSLNLSSFDASNASSTSSFLKNCDSLSAIDTPKNFPAEIALTTEFYDPTYNFYTSLPQNLSNSLHLTKGPADGTAAKVTVKDQAYTGSALEPDLTVTLNGITISEEHYTVSYKDNTKIGKATAIVTFQGHFTGTASGSFNIKGSEAKKGDVVQVGAAKYEIKDNNTVQFEQPTNINATTVKIPESVIINGKKYYVTSIDNNAFVKMKKLKKIDISPQVKNIGSNALKNISKKIKNITIIIRSKNLNRVKNYRLPKILKRAKNSKRKYKVKAKAKKVYKYLKKKLKKYKHIKVKR